jgi:hypothetical protein
MLLTLVRPVSRRVGKGAERAVPTLTRSDGGHAWLCPPYKS